MTMMDIQIKRGYYHNLFSWKEFESFINVRPLMTDQRVEVLNNKVYTWDNTPWAKYNNCYPPSILKEVLETEVCYFKDMSRLTKKINSLAKRFEEIYKRQTDAHIYVCRNPKIKHPFGVHYDLSDNIIVQCEGKTNFKVWGSVDPEKYEQRDKLPVPKEEPIVNVVLESGDAIWIPRHYLHLATSKTSRLSVSFPMSYASPNGYFEERDWIEL